MGERFRRVVARSPRAPAILEVGAGGERRVIPFGELLASGEAVARRLVTLEVRPGDAVVVYGRNSAALVVALVGCALAGAPCVPVHPGLGWETAARAAARTGARVVVLADDTAPPGPALAGSTAIVALPGVRSSAPSLDAVAPSVASLPEVAPDAVLAILLSTGSSGPPKLAPRSHARFGVAGHRFGEDWGAGPGRRFAACTSLCHAAAFGWGLLPTLLHGSTLVIPVDRRPEALVAAIAATEPHVAFFVPTQGRAIVALPGGARVRGLDRAIFGGEPLDLALARAVGERLGCAVQNTYGMTEGFCTATDPTSLDQIAAGSAGRPCFEEDELRVANVDAEGIGVLWVRGPATIDGYLGGEGASAFSDDGFYDTGDRVRLHGRDVCPVGRSALVVNRGGYKISPEQIEALLREHPAFRAVAAVGLPDDRRGERLVLLYASKPDTVGPTRAELCAWLAGRGVGTLLFPDTVAPVEDLPLNAVGKIDRLAARRIAATSSPSQGANA